jgi:hypothetical protein
MRKQRQRNNRRAVRIVLTALLIILCPVALTAQDASAARLVEKMRAALGPEMDCSLRLTASFAGAGARPAAVYYYFRSDARHSGLLYLVSPADARGYALLRREDRLTAYNPACRCARDTDPAAVVRRFGLGLKEIDPRLLLTVPVSGEAAAGRLEDRPVFVVTLQSGTPGRTPRLYLDADSFLPLRLEERDASGRTTRTVDYTAYYDIGGYRVVRRLIIAAPGAARLEITVDRISRHPLPDYVFTPAYLEEVSPLE